MHTIELPKLPKVRDIAKATSIVTGVPLGDIYSEMRFKNMVRARWIVFYVSRYSLLRSYPFIGNCFNKDHSTVMHGVEGAKRLIEKGDEKFISQISEVKKAAGLSDEKAVMETIERWEKQAIAHTMPILRSFATTIHRDLVQSSNKETA